ncbi:hypothetical protein AVT69_gp191 [Pseudomonas phage PhiPA3]|uniref:Uncharacterized protein 193 n=1 Tax=Pseudomonas phage PhiPA3 TaxID=998086 RepID=F8SK62_BPPA3|nr:hypothetical protein AVT69_gp191 [Pseudomonas phage PhiPA3]AEH03616.1 hypothetical protein [Pseudomonas phage PhiPA3]
MSIAAMMNRIAKRIRLIQVCPMRVYVTLRAATGAYFDVDIDNGSFCFTVRSSASEGRRVMGTFQIDSETGWVMLTSFYNEMYSTEFGDLLHSIDRTLELHKDCYGLVINNLQLMEEDARVRWFH